MFGLFKTRTEHVEELMDNIKQAGYIEPAKQPTKNEPAYQVGKTEDGKVTLQMGGMYGTTTITMTDAGVRQLIRMLEAAMENPGESEAK